MFRRLVADFYNLSVQGFSRASQKIVCEWRSISLNRYPILFAEFISSVPVKVSLDRPESFSIGYENWAIGQHIIMSGIALINEL
jgi:hypothetical protein